jgi:hypothetical protein
LCAKCVVRLGMNAHHLAIVSQLRPNLKLEYL